MNAASSGELQSHERALSSGDVTDPAKQDSADWAHQEPSTKHRKRLEQIVIDTDVRESSRRVGHRGGGSERCGRARGGVAHITTTATRAVTWKEGGTNVLSQRAKHCKIVPCKSSIHVAHTTQS